MIHRLTLILLFVLPAAAAAQGPSSDAAERARIEGERARAESEFAAREQACYAKFAVNDCIEDAKTQRRTVLADLRRQEVALNDAQRRRRAADRVREIEARQAEQSVPPKGREQTRAPAPPAAPAAPSATPGAEATGPARTASVPAAPRPVRPPPDAGENARRHQERVREAERHKADAQKRAAENKKPGRPLPTPP